MIEKLEDLKLTEENSEKSLDSKENPSEPSPTSESRSARDKVFDNHVV